MADFYLRLRTSDRERPEWVRRNLFSLGWSRISLMECAAKFPDRDQAVAFAREYHLLADVELVILSSEALNAG